MTVFVVITYKLSFSSQIIEYFKELNPLNNFCFVFLPIGLDMDKESLIIEKAIKKIESYSKLENVVIFSDVGTPAKLAKRIKIKKENVKIICSKGSLIENGYLTYLMMNTRTPIEIVEKITDKNIEK